MHNCKIVSDYIYFDRMGLAEQLGLIPSVYAWAVRTGAIGCVRR